MVLRSYMAIVCMCAGIIKILFLSIIGVNNWPRVIRTLLHLNGIHTHTCNIAINLAFLLINFITINCCMSVDIVAHIVKINVLLYTWSILYISTIDQS